MSIFKKYWIEKINKSGVLTDKQLKIIRNKMEIWDDQNKTYSQKVNSVKRLTPKLKEKYKAERVVRTEEKRIESQDVVNDADELGLEKFKVMTQFGACDKCKALAGKIYTSKEIEKDGSPIIPHHPNCWLDHQVQIYTSKGWKHINKINVGDLVLTDKGRFRKVEKLLNYKKYTGEAYKIWYRKNKYLFVTPEHLLLTDSGWKEAKNILVTDHLISLASKCIQCKKLFSISTKSVLNNTFPIFCDKRCERKHCALEQWKYQDRKLIGEKISKTNLKLYKEGKIDRFFVTRNCADGIKNKLETVGYLIPKENRLYGDKNPSKRPEVKKQISNGKIGELNPMYQNKEAGEKIRQSNIQRFILHPEKHPNRILAQKGHRTGIEKEMQSILEEIGLKDFQYNYKVLNYYIDYGLLNHKIAIECDGEYWHTNKESDLIRQNKIEKEGWTFLRFTGKEIMKNKEEVKKEIQRILLNHNHEYKFIETDIINIEKATLKKARKLYDFSVEEDHSYIAKGIVSHNCNCIIIPVVD